MTEPAPETPNPTDVAATDPATETTPAPHESTLHRYLDEIEKLVAKVRSLLKGGTA